MKQYIPSLLLAIMLFSSFQLAYAQKIDVYSRPVQKEPDRECDFIHYRIKLKIDEAAKSFMGENQVTLTPFSDDFQSCTLDAGDIR